MEELLNKLIEKGWKPFGMKCTFEYVDILCNQPYRFKHLNARVGASLRELVSKESGLWQFVCENKLVKPQVYAWYFYREGMGKEVCKEDYEFRLIESALCDEDKLEEFLLENIKVE